MMHDRMNDCDTTTKPLYSLPFLFDTDIISKVFAHVV